MNINIVTRMLKNRRYIGEYSYQDVFFEDGVPAIVSKELFEKVPRRMEKNKKAPARFKAEDEYLLSTKLFCGKCGAYMTGESGTSHTMKVHRYYKCYHTRKPRTCTKKNVKKDWIEDFVITETMKMVFDDSLMEYLADMLMEMQQAENTRLPALQQQLAKTEQGIRNLVDAIQAGIFTPSTKERLDELESTQEKLKTAILQEEIQQAVFTRDQIFFFLHSFRNLDMAQLDHRRQMIDTFVNAVYLYDDKVVLTFNYKEGTRTITLAEVQGSGLVTRAAPDLEVKKDIWAKTPVFKRPRRLVSWKVHEPEILDIREGNIQTGAAWTRARDRSSPLSRSQPSCFPALEISWAFSISRKGGKMMKYPIQESRSQFFEELKRKLADEGIQSKMAGVHYLWVYHEGTPICEIDTSGSTYRVAGCPEIPESGQITRQAAQIASQVREYMIAMETAPPLLAEGLDPRDGYRLLAEYNSCLLAGRQSEYGCQFVTGQWDDEHKHLLNGRYRGGDYKQAKEDFATRSQLVDEDRIFQPEQMKSLYKALTWYLEECPGISHKEARWIEALQGQMERACPGLEEQDFTQEQGSEMTMQ